MLELIVGLHNIHPANNADEVHNFTSDLLVIWAFCKKRMAMMVITKTDLTKVDCQLGMENKIIIFLVPDDI